MSYHLSLNILVKVTIYKKIAISQLLYDRCLPIIHTNDGTVTSHKNIIYADLENVGQGHYLQKSLYLGYYTTDFNQSSTKLLLLGQTTKHHIS